MKRCRIFLAHAAIFSLCLATVTPGTVSGAKAKKPKLSKGTLTITAGNTQTIKLSRAGKKAKVTWSTNKKKVLKLSNKKKTSCKVKGLKKEMRS